MPTRFQALNILREGTGAFHANRFRIYFEPPKGWTLHALADDFMNEFPVLFDGISPIAVFPADPPLSTIPSDNTAIASRPVMNIGGVTLRRNIAQVKLHQIAAQRMLQFTGDMRGLWGQLNVPDVHDDWVGEIWHVPGRGMAVQTQRQILDQTEGSGLLSLLSPIAVIVSDGIKLAERFNASHFLAGRRSWVLGEERARIVPVSGTATSSVSAATGRLHSFRATTSTYWYLETAALERYSSAFYEVVAANPHAFGWAMPDLDASIREVWITQLFNFVRLYRLNAAVLDPNTSYWPAETAVIDKVRFTAHHYVTLDKCLAEPWVTDMLAAHPALADQLTDLPEVVVTTPRKASEPGNQSW